MPPADILLQLLDLAKKAGAEAADALIYESVSSNVSVRLGQVEDLERSENRDLGLRVFIGRQQASVSTTDFAPESLQATAERCVAMARTAPEDPYCGLAPKERLFDGDILDLELFDGAEPSSDDLRDRALECEQAALDVAGVTNSSGASAGFGSGCSWFATSDGFLGKNEGGSHSVSVSVLAGEGTSMERDYDYDSATHLSELRDGRAVGASAGERAVRRLNPRKLSSRSAPVLFEQRLSRSLLGHLSGAVNGGAIARGVSFLKDKMGAQLFPENITISDDPHRKRGFGSQMFDGEGVTSLPFNLIEKGVLTQWIMNTAHARQLGLETNGRATRGTGGPPSAAPTNLTLLPGTHSLDQLMEMANQGLYLTDMFGPQINANNGDYSVGCSGFWIENGVVAYPVSEITIAGNLLDMYAGLIAGNDLVYRGSLNAPSLLIEQMTIAGD